MSEAGNAGVVGYAPAVAVGAGNKEAEKYGRMWEHPEYRAVAPGEALAQVFLQHARPKPGASVIDFGCGTGRGSLLLAVLGNLNVTMVDFARNCLDDDIRPMLETQAHVMRFVKADLEQPLPCAAEYGFCTDVMEHIPPDKVDIVLNHILRAAQHVFFSISTVDDACGALIGEPLHLSVHPYAWWLGKFNERGAVIHWSQDAGDACLFYVTAWSTGEDVVKVGSVNTEVAQIRDNVRANLGLQAVDTKFVTGVLNPETDLYDFPCSHADACATGAHGAAFWLLQQQILDGVPFEQTYINAGLAFRLHDVVGVKFGPFPLKGCVGENPNDECRVDYWWGNSNLYWPFTLAEWEGALRAVGATVPRWAQVRPHEPSDVEVMILGGGPSIAAFEDEIREKRDAGIKVVTLNGAYQWALDRELGPVTEVIVDARPFNARFVQPVDARNLYLIGSQCDPSVLTALWDGLVSGGVALPLQRVLLWHTMADEITDLLTAAYPDGQWWAIPGGSTVLLRAIPLLRMLGFRRFHLYGCDSCLGDEERHHAYSQPENDAAPVLNVTVGGRVFLCQPWMVSQAQELIDMIRAFGDEIELSIAGDGLLACLLETAAGIDDVQELTPRAEARALGG